MGTVFSNKKDETTELKNKNNILTEELRTSKRYNENLKNDLHIMKEEMSSYEKQIHLLLTLNSVYKKVICTDRGNTADIIMKSNLHLDYLDDSVEKKHICDVLKAAYDITNQYYKSKTESD